MATNQYITGRRKYSRPQAILFSDNAGILQNGFYLPLGYEIGVDQEGIEDIEMLDQFIILSDDNRQPIEFKPIRIETRERTINGNMRSYHVADKRTISVSWNMLPSRAFKGNADFNSETGKTDNVYAGKPIGSDYSYTTDGGAGGVEILDWYNVHKGSFWVFLAYDNYKELGLAQPETNLGKYNEVIEMFVSDFSHSVVKRGSSNYDFWNISMTLEEV